MACEGDQPSGAEDISESESEQGDVVQSPAGLRYNISGLSRKTRRMVREVFSPPDTVDHQPRVSLDFCEAIEEEDGPGATSTGAGAVYYAFQMHEYVPCSVRIGSRSSARYAAPRCFCREHKRSPGPATGPCRHLIWLSDRIAQLALAPGDHDWQQQPGPVLKLTERGYAAELGDMFQQLSGISLNRLVGDDGRAAGAAAAVATATPRTANARAQVAREVVAAVAGVSVADLKDALEEEDEDEKTAGGVDEGRGIETASNNKKGLIRRGDPVGTLYALALASHTLASWMRSQLGEDAAYEGGASRDLDRQSSAIISELDASSTAPRRRGQAAASHGTSGAGSVPRAASGQAAPPQGEDEAEGATAAHLSSPSVSASAPAGRGSRGGRGVGRARGRGTKRLASEERGRGKRAR